MIPQNKMTGIENPIFEYGRNDMRKIDAAKKLLRSRGYLVINIEDEKKKHTAE